MHRTDDPLADFSSWDYELFEMGKKLPKCRYCEEPIFQDRAVYIKELEAWVCDNCLWNMRCTVESDYEE